MGLYTLERGLMVRIGAAQYRVQQVAAPTIQLEHTSTGKIIQRPISRFTQQVLDGTIELLRDSDLTPPISADRQNRGILCFDSLPRHQQDEYVRAHKYVRGMLKRSITKGQRQRIAESIPVIAASEKDDRPPTASTVMRWMRLYENSGRNSGALISRNFARKRCRSMNAETRTIIDGILRRHFFIRNGCTIRTAYERVIRELERKQQLLGEIKDQTTVSLSTVRRIVNETSPFDRDRARLGQAAARAKWRFSKPGKYVTRPLERVELDHTLLDLWVIDDDFGIPLGRPTLTLLTCSYSGYIVGFYVSFEGESLARIVQSIKIAIQPKDTLTAGANLVNRWLGEGLWETLLVDNAVACHSTQFLCIGAELCMDIEFCPVRMPWFKPVVERTIGELTRQLPAQGRPQKPGRHPDPINPASTACITFNDLCAGILRWVVDVHPFEQNHSKRDCPYNLFKNGLEMCPAPTLVDSFVGLDILAGVSRTKTVDHNGIVNSWIRYTDDDLRQIQRDTGTKFKANIKFNPNDLGHIFVQHPREKRWLSVPAKDYEYAKGLSLTQHKLIRAAAEQRLTSANAEKVLRDSRLALEDFWHNAILSGKKLKKISKDYAKFRGRNSVISSRAIVNEPTSETAQLIVPEDELVIPAQSIPTFDTFSMEEI